MSGRTALSLQTEEHLDLAELAKACELVGLIAGTRHLSKDGYVIEITFPGSRKRLRWGGRKDHGFVGYLLRDAVRRVAPGSHCIPMLAEGYPPLVVVILDGSRLPIETDPLPSPYYGRGNTETECWARAFVALLRAGMLPFEPKEADPHKSVGYIPPICEDSKTAGLLPGGGA